MAGADAMQLGRPSQTNPYLVLQGWREQEIRADRHDHGSSLDPGQSCRQPTPLAAEVMLEHGSTEGPITEGIKPAFEGGKLLMLVWMAHQPLGQLSELDGGASITGIAMV
jgi:hypothetical protein